MEDFIGEGGSLDWPEAVVSPSLNDAAAGYSIEGYEALGGLRFKDASLPAGAVLRLCTHPGHFARCHNWNVTVNVSGELIGTTKDLYRIKQHLLILND